MPQLYTALGNKMFIIDPYKFSSNDLDTNDIFGDSSIIATYQLNSNANDLGGNYNCTEVSASYGAGKFDNALTGGRAYHAVTGLSTTNISFSYWVKIDTYNSSAAANVCVTPTTASESIFIGHSSAWDNGFIAGFGSTAANGGGGYFIANSPIGINDGNWHHVVFTKAAGTYKAYIDGSEIACTYSNSGYYTHSTAGIGIKAGVAGQYPSSDAVDQVRIFNRALTSTEVTTLFNEGT